MAGLCATNSNNNVGPRSSMCIVVPAADANLSHLSIKLTPQPEPCARLHLARMMARCAGHGFCDVADEEDQCLEL